MRRRIFPSVLLYGFGLALALSLWFNGYLLLEQGRLPGPGDDDADGPTRFSGQVAWQRQLSECQRANQHKDSLIHRLEQLPGALSAQTGNARPAHLQ